MQARTQTMQTETFVSENIILVLVMNTVVKLVDYGPDWTLPRLRTYLELLEQFPSSVERAAVAHLGVQFFHQD